MIYSLPILPTTTPATGPSNGILLIVNAKDDPSNAVISGEQF